MAIVCEEKNSVPSVDCRGKKGLLAQGSRETVKVGRRVHVPCRQTAGLKGFTLFVEERDL